MPRNPSLLSSPERRRGVRRAGIALVLASAALNGCDSQERAHCGGTYPVSTDGRKTFGIPDGHGGRVWVQESRLARWDSDEQLVRDSVTFTIDTQQDGRAIVTCLDRDESN